MDLMGIHILWCSHGEHIIVQNTIKMFFLQLQEMFIFMFCMKKHILSSPSLEFLCWWVDIVLTINEVYILIDVIIIDPTQMDLVSWIVVS